MEVEMWALILMGVAKKEGSQKRLDLRWYLPPLKIELMTLGFVSLAFLPSVPP